MVWGQPLVCLRLGRRLRGDSSSSPSTSEGQASRYFNIRPRENLLRYQAFVLQEQKRAKRTTRSQSLLSLPARGPPSVSTLEGRASDDEASQNRSLLLVGKLGTLGFAVFPFPTLQQSPLQALSGLTVPTPSRWPCLQGRGHSPEAAAQGVLLGWAIVLPGERQA